MWILDAGINISGKARKPDKYSAQGLEKGVNIPNRGWRLG
jgi:hypothetical protein